MRSLRRWWPVLAALIFLSAIVLGGVVLYAAITRDSGLFEGTWRRVGDTGSQMTVGYQAEQCTLRFSDGGGASQTVPAAVGYVDLEATLPPSTDPALLGGQTAGENGLPITVTAAPEHGSLIVSSGTGPGGATTVLWTYEPAGLFARSIPGWAALTIVVCAFLVVAVLLFGSPSAVTSGRDKAQRVLVVAVGAVLFFALITRSNAALTLVRPLVAACWALFLVRVLPGQVPVVGEGLGVVFLPSRRHMFIQGLAAQDDQGDRGDAMEEVLQRAIDERGVPDGRPDGDDRARRHRAGAGGAHRFAARGLWRRRRGIRRHLAAHRRPRLRAHDHATVGRLSVEV
jgi:hypothetical protein